MIAPPSLFLEGVMTRGCKLSLLAPSQKSIIRYVVALVYQRNFVDFVENGAQYYF
jgi:hypothetical protein